MMSQRVSWISNETGEYDVVIADPTKVLGAGLFINHKRDAENVHFVPSDNIVDVLFERKDKKQ